MDKFLIELQGKLDEAKSKGNINADIGKLQNQIDKLKVQVELDPKALSNIVKQLEPIIGQKIKIPNLTVDSKVGQQIGNNIGQNIADGISKASGKVSAEAQKLANQVNKIQLSIDNGHGASEYQNRINTITSSLKKYGIETKEVQHITASLQSTFDKMKKMSGHELVTQADKLEQEFKSVKASVEQAKLSYDKLIQPASKEKISSTLLKVQKLLSNNTKVTEAVKNEWQGYVSRLSSGSDIAVKEINDINIRLKETESNMRGMGKLGLSWTDKLKQAWEKFGGWGFATGTMMAASNKIKSSITELKEIDSILTEISKTSNRTQKSLRQLGNDSFETASDYGRNASDYLIAVQEMNRSGFYDEKGNAMAEQSILAQSAGDMTEEIADKWILATNAAYKYEGEAKKINAVLDGANSITNKNSVNMTDMAEAMSIVGSSAAQAGVAVDELSSIIGTSVATTKKEGNEIGTSWKSILVNLQNISSDKVVNTLNEANASMTETKNGIEQLRSPIVILKDLAKTYNSLDAKDPLKSKITANIGGKYHANVLSAFLANYDQYEKMLNDYADGTGSAMEEAQKSANNWEGSWNRVNNTITDIVDNLINTDSIISGINGFNDLLEDVNKLTSSFKTLATTIGTIGLTVLNQKKGGGFIKLISSINNSPFLATVECNSDVYDSYAFA